MEIINGFAKQKLYRPRQTSNSEQKCPYCQKLWNWSNSRWLEYYKQGYITINCKNCKRPFTVYKNKGEYRYGREEE